jgi:hypothetical protein
MSLFEYLALEAPKESIRLLRILPGTDPLAIECKMYCFSLEKCPPYVAVSYTWGSSAAGKEIKLGNQTLSVRQNIWNFLCQMHGHGKFRLRFFWIDAICINQRDIEERNVQVSIMQQIYATAAEVIVWLGREAEQSRLAMDYIAQQKKIIHPAKLSGGYRSHRQQIASQKFWKDEEGKALLALCQRPYWRRIWIVQEIMNAERIVVFCGPHEVQWEDFSKVFEQLKSIRLFGWFDRYRYGSEVLASQAALIVEEKARWQTRRGLEEGGVCLSTLIESYRHLECTHPLDKVYGLLGLSINRISIDYRKTRESIFNEVLTLACETQLPTRHAKESFEATLLKVLSLSKGNQSIITVASLMYRPTKAEQPTASTYYRSETICKKAQPIVGDPEMEMSRCVEPPQQGSGIFSDITSPSRPGSAGFPYPDTEEWYPYPDIKERYPYPDIEERYKDPYPNIKERYPYPDMKERYKDPYPNIKE